MRKNRINRSPLALGIPLALLYGCTAHPRHVMFHQTTVVGVDVAVSPETNNVKAAFGYDRNTVAFVPTWEVAAEGGQKKYQAMSVVGLTRIKVPWFKHQTIAEHLLTGQAAQNIAEQPDAIRELLKSLEAPAKRANTGGEN